jgi:uncharacterized Zn-finger protein
MPAATVTSPPHEVVIVHEHRIACDGLGGALGHPRVYLEMGGKHSIDCPYCGRRYTLAGHDHGEDERLDPAAYEPVDTPEA